MNTTERVRRQPRRTDAQAIYGRVEPAAAQILRESAARVGVSQSIYLEALLLRHDPQALADLATADDELPMT